MANVEGMLDKLIAPQRVELARPLLRTADDAMWLENTLTATVACRQAGLSRADIVVYTKQLSLLDGEKYTRDDVAKALQGIATAPRGEYETAMPSLGEVLALVDDERRKRTRDTAQAASAKRMAEQEAYAEKLRQEREEAWTARMEREARAAAEQAAIPTQTPQASTPPPSHNVEDMQPDECDAFVTLLETMSYDSLVMAARAASVIHSADDQAAVARALRALWLTKGKDARNLLVLVKGEKTG